VPRRPIRVTPDRPEPNRPNCLRDERHETVSDPWIWIAIVSALASAHFVALRLSLEEFSRSELEAFMDRRNRGRNSVEWLMGNVEPLRMATSIWRMFMAVMLVISGMMLLGWAEAPESRASTTGLVLAAVGLGAWLCIEIGLARATAAYAAAPMVARSLWLLRLVHVLTRVVIIPLDGLAEVVRRLVGGEERDDLEDELRHVAEESEREGQLAGVVKGMIENIADFRDATVDEIMTPRIDVRGIDPTSPIDEVMSFIIESGHSRYPVYTDDVDHIEGILYVKDLLPFVGRDRAELDLKELARESFFVPESRKISDLLVDFQQQRIHLAVVIDEYGGTAGVVTIEDIVEEIVGEIRDEHDHEEIEEPSFSRNDDGTIDVDARFHVDDLNDELGLELPEEEDFDTIGGWVFATIGRIPAAGEQVQADGVEATILEVERTHINKIRLRALDEYADDSSNGKDA
jgi:putative hemolysin